MTVNKPIGWDDSIRQFIEQAGSASPTPGGGSVAALVAALGVAMTSMFGHLSSGEKYAAVREQMAGTLEELRTLSVKCELLLAADIESFERYMRASKLPKLTEQERAVRGRELGEAALAALEVPLQLMEACRDGLRSTVAIAGAGNKNVISDLGIGAVLLEAAAQSAHLTVEINLAALRDAERKAAYAARASALNCDIAALKEQALTVVRERIG
jgi:formiminotetrahydrofolate cyclodeaminase